MSYLSNKILDVVAQMFFFNAYPLHTSFFILANLDLPRLDCQSLLITSDI